MILGHLVTACSLLPLMRSMLCHRTKAAIVDLYLLRNRYTMLTRCMLYQFYTLQSYQVLIASRLFFYLYNLWLLTGVRERYEWHIFVNWRPRIHFSEESNIAEEAIRWLLQLSPFPQNYYLDNHFCNLLLRSGVIGSWICPFIQDSLYWHWPGCVISMLTVSKILLLEKMN